MELYLTADELKMYHETQEKAERAEKAMDTFETIWSYLCLFDFIRYCGEEFLVLFNNVN